MIRFLSIPESLKYALADLDFWVTLFEFKSNNIIYQEFPTCSLNQISFIASPDQGYYSRIYVNSEQLNELAITVQFRYPKELQKFNIKK